MSLAPIPTFSASLSSHSGSTPRHTFHRSITMSNGTDFHDCKKPIVNKIRSLLAFLVKKPSEYDQIAPKIEYWIEYVLREDFMTVDDLVEGVSYVAWGDCACYANVPRFLKEFHDAPHRCDQARTFITQLCSHVLRWFAIASVELLSMGWSNGEIANGGGSGLAYAASFVGHLIERGLLSQELVRRHLIKPLINHYHGDNNSEPNWELIRAYSIYSLFIAAGGALFQGLLEAEDIRVCFEILDAQSRNITVYNVTRIQVWFTTYTKASQRCLICGSGTSRDSHHLVTANGRRRTKGCKEDSRMSGGRRGRSNYRGPCRG